MSFKGFIKTNYLRFIYINILSVISGVAAIGAGYIQMYWLTYIKDRAWVKILLATALMGILYLAAQGMIYYIQFVIRVQEEEYNKRCALVWLHITLEMVKIIKYRPCKIG